MFVSIRELAMRIRALFPFLHFLDIASLHMKFLLRVGSDATINTSVGITSDNESLLREDNAEYQHSEINLISNCTHHNRDYASECDTNDIDDSDEVGSSTSAR
jgi:hypothetical protein